MIRRPTHLDAFLDWTMDNKSEGTYGWYRDKLQSFKDGMPDLQVSKIDTLAVEERLRTKTTWGPTVCKTDEPAPAGVARGNV